MQPEWGVLDITIYWNVVTQKSFTICNCMVTLLKKFKEIIENNCLPALLRKALRAGLPEVSVISWMSVISWQTGDRKKNSILPYVVEWTYFEIVKATIKNKSFVFLIIQKNNILTHSPSQGGQARMWECSRLIIFESLQKAQLFLSWTFLFCCKNLIAPPQSGR